MDRVQKQASVPTSGQCLRVDPDLLRIRSGMLTVVASGLGQMDRVQKQASVQELQGPLLANAFDQIWISCGSDLACLLWLCSLSRLVL